MTITKKACIALVFSGLAFFAKAQFGGENVYQILNMSPSAKITSLGGYSLTLNDGNPSIAYFNPSIIDSTYINNFSSSYSGLFIKMSDIGYGNVTYSNRYSKYVYAVGFQSLNYGKIDSYDEYGNSLGTAVASDHVLFLSVSESINNNFTWGFSVKPIFSFLDSYKSYAIAGDLALSYHDSSKSSLLSLCARNIGYQLKGYTEGTRGSMPFSLDLGYTKRFNHAPFRFSILYKGIQKFNLDYDSPIEERSSITSLDTSTTKDTKVTFADAAGRFSSHIVLGAELLLHKNFNVSLGFNPRKRRELRYEENMGLVGFSFGFQAVISKFKICYGHERYNRKGGLSTFTLSTNLADVFSTFTKKKTL